MEPVLNTKREKLMCRVCESRDLLINIYTNEAHKIVEKICFCASVQISENDGLPEHICTKCFTDLETAYAFRKRCEEADSRFRHIVEIKTELLETSIEDNFVGNNDDQNKYEMESELPVLINNEEYEELNFVYDIKSDNSSSGYPEDSNKKKKNAPKIYTCETCGEELKVRSDYYVHIKSHGAKRFQCKTCSKWFSRRSKLVSHELAHDGLQKRHPCTQCSMDFNCRPALVRHIAGVHENRRDYVCTICGKGFAQKSGLQTHQTVHSESTYACSKCPATYKNKRFWMRHEQLHLPPEERNAKLVFKSQQQKPKQRIYVCSFCGKISNNLVTHVVHERYHLDERPYPCQLCDKKFRCSSMRNKHMRTHTGEKPFKCEVCGACFREKSHLTTHNLIHTQERNHVCQICCKAFALKATLKSHMKCHKVFVENK